MENDQTQAKINQEPVSPVPSENNQIHQTSSYPTNEMPQETKPIRKIEQDFISGGLPVKSYIRPDKLFTAEHSIVSTIYGALKPEKLRDTLSTLRNLFVDTQ